MTHAAEQGRMVDAVEARLDVRLKHPLVRAAAQVVNLGDCVLGASVGTEPIRAGLEACLEDRFEHQLECGLHYPVPYCRDAQPAQLAASFRNHPFAHGQGAEPPSPEVGAQICEERLRAAHLLDVPDGLPVHAGCACTLVPLDPYPSCEQEGRVADEIEEVVERAILMFTSPSVQLGLHLQYPGRGLLGGRPRRAGVHRRPPGLATPTLRTRCLPWPCGRLSRPRTTTQAPPHLTPSADGGLAHHLSVGGRCQVVPTFAVAPFDGSGVQLCPCGLATGTPQSFPMASLPATLIQRGSRPHVQACTASQPLSAGFELVGFIEGL